MPSRGEVAARRRSTDDHEPLGSPAPARICAFFSGPARPGRRRHAVHGRYGGVAQGRMPSASWESLSPADARRRARPLQVDLGRSLETRTARAGHAGDATACAPGPSPPTTCCRTTGKQAAAAARAPWDLACSGRQGEEIPSNTGPSRQPQRSYFRYEAELNGIVASLPAGDLLPLRPADFGAEVLMDTLRTRLYGGRGQRDARQPVLRRPGRVPPRHGVGNGGLPSPGRPPSANSSPRCRSLLLCSRCC